MVTNTLQQRIPKIRLGAVSAALALVVVLGLEVVTTQSAQAQSLTVLYNFTGSSDGGVPYAYEHGVVLDGGGNIYGTTFYGGALGYGTVFKVDTSGAETVLHSFTGGGDGGFPVAGLVRDAAGNLYGTTEYGGSSSHGVVFKVDTRGTETVLHSFAGGARDGCRPYGGLLQDEAGNLYGTTEECGASGRGTVFKVSKTGKETVLHSFAGGATDGAFPYAGLVRDAAGNLYGTTLYGGIQNERCSLAGYGCGVLFALDMTGKETVLHAFNYKSDGCNFNPSGTPIMDKKGNFYGTTPGCAAGHGVVWRVSKEGTETVLHTFGTTQNDGLNPFPGLIMDAEGNLYGTTGNGTGIGASIDGSVYELNKDGTITLLHVFAGFDGDQPAGGLIRDAEGNLYGTTSAGGASGWGTVFKLTP